MFRMSNLSWSEDVKPKAAERHTPTFANYRATLSPESCAPRTLEDDDAFMQMPPDDRGASGRVLQIRRGLQGVGTFRASQRANVARHSRLVSLLITLLSLLQQFGVLRAFAVFLAGLL